MEWDANRTNFDRNLAVVIGIDRYDSPGIHNLSTAVNDARTITDLLQTDYGYQEENIIRLFSPRSDDATLKALKQPYREATLNELNLLLNDTLPNKLKPTEGDRLLFYFAGHGIPQESEDGPAGYLIPQTAELGNLKTYLPMRELHDALKQLSCHHLLIILDCCFGGMFRWASSRKLISVLETVRREHYDRFIRYPAWQVITSAAHNQEALDLSVDPRKADENSRHSPFAQALIEGLQHNEDLKRVNADLISDGVITAHELYLYLNNRVNELSKERQTPGIYPMRLEYDKGEYIFTRPDFKRDDLDPAPDLNEENNPYRGLKSFDEKHSAFFFGRDALVKELSDRLAKPGRSLIIVLGTSGSGKSSLVKAGLIPYLREKQNKDQQAQKWYILDPMRPGKSPFTELARTILSIADANLLQHNSIKVLDDIFKPKETETGDRSTQAGQAENGLETNAASSKLAAAWNSATLAAKLLLVVDYFEELHKLHPTDALSKLKVVIQGKVEQLTRNLRSDQRYLSEVIATWSQTHPSNKLLLVIDQFEELITMAEEPQDGNQQNLQDRQREGKEWQQFLKMLRMTLASHRHRMHIVLTLRSDFEPRFLDSELKSHWRRGRFPVRAMNSEELRQAIEGPALKQALVFNPENLVSTLIDEVGQMPGALPLLSFALSELYIKLHRRWVDKKDTDRSLKLEDYTELGGVAGSLTRRATEEYDKLVKDKDAKDEYQGGFGKEEGKAYQATMRRVMLRMVTIEGGGVARRRVLKSELVYSSDEENERVKLVIDRLVHARLLVKGQETGEAYVEPGHDFLVRGWDKLQIWIKEKQEDLALQQRLTPAAKDWTKNEGGLWTREPERLDQLKKILTFDKNWLNSIETKFVNESQTQRIRELEEAIRQRDEAIQGQIGALTKASEVLLSNNQQLEALVTGMKAGKKLKETGWEETDFRISTLIALQQAVDGIQEYNRFESHANNVLRVSFSPDGEIIASASEDNTVKLWKRDGTLIRTLQGHSHHRVYDVTFSPDGQIIASAGGDNKIVLWSRKGKKLQTLNSHENSVISVTFNPEGQVIASASTDDTVILWNRNGQKLNSFKVIERNSSTNPFPGFPGFSPLSSDIMLSVKDASFSPDGQLVAVATTSEVQLRKLDGTLLDTLKGGGNKIKFSPNGEMLALAASDGTVTLKKVNGELIKTLEGHGRWVTSVSFSPDGGMIAVSSEDQTVRLWNCDGQEIKVLRGHSGIVTDVSFSPDGQMLASASYDGTVRVWSIHNTLINLNLRHSDYIERASFGPDGQIIISAFGIKIFNHNGVLLHKFEGIGNYPALSPDGQLVAVSSVGDIEVWSLNGSVINKFPIQKGSIWTLSFSPNGKMLASGGSDKKVRLLSLDDNHSKILKGHKRDVRDVNFSPDGEILASASEDGLVKLWSLDGLLIKTLVGHEEGVSTVIFSRNGQTIATAGYDGVLKLWNRDDGNELRSWRGHSNWIPSMSFGFNDQLIASASADGTVKLWSLDGTLLKTFTEHNDFVGAVAFSSDDQTLASVSKDKSVAFRSFDLDGLLSRGCKWLHGYLETNPNLSKKDRDLCHLG